MKKILENTAWLLFEKIINIFGALIITIYVARYLGPTNMGVINYALAVSAIIVSISQLGSDTLIFNRTAKNKQKGKLLLLATKNIRLYLSITLSLLFIIIYFFSERENTDNQTLITLSLMMLFSIYTSIDVYRYYFDAIFKSKFNSIASQIGIYSSLIIRFIFVKLNLGLAWFSVPFILSALIPYLVRKAFFIKKEKKTIIVKKYPYLKYTATIGFPLAISSLSIIFYTRVNQVLLAKYSSMYDVGIYNAALTLAQAWMFVPIALITPLFSGIIKNYQSFDKGISFLYLIMLIVSLPILSITFFFPSEIILLTYGNNFIEANKIIFILNISSVFSVLGTISYRTIIYKGGHRYIMIKSILMALLNVILNYTLINQHGLIGAAYSILITEIISSTIANFFFKNFYITKLMLNLVVSFNYITNLIEHDQKK